MPWVTKRLFDAWNRPPLVIQRLKFVGKFQVFSTGTLGALLTWLAYAGLLLSWPAVQGYIDVTQV
jgi:hypothetical protein